MIQDEASARRRRASCGGGTTFLRQDEHSDVVDFGFRSSNSFDGATLRRCFYAPQPWQAFAGLTVDGGQCRNGQLLELCLLNHCWSPLSTAAYRDSSKQPVYTLLKPWLPCRCVTYDPPRHLFRDCLSGVRQPPPPWYTVADRAFRYEPSRCHQMKSVGSATGCRRTARCATSQLLDRLSPSRHRLTEGLLRQGMYRVIVSSIKEGADAAPVRRHRLARSDVSTFTHDFVGDVLHYGRLVPAEGGMTGGPRTGFG
jgi:hypothetical protein